MKIMVSACLLGENCKYNGGNNYSEKLQDFLKGHKVISVCPEVMGGLSVPRNPAEIVNGIVMTAQGQNVDAQFRKGAEAAFEIAVREKVDLIVLQSRSPSCGAKEVYDGSFRGRKISGQGIFARMLLDAGFPILDVEDI